MHQPQLQLPTSPRRHKSSTLMLQLTGLGGLLIGIVWAIAAVLETAFGGPDPQLRSGIPPAFQVSTLLLLVGSVFMHRALAAVRIERQREFRRNLMFALVTGTAFAGLQTYAIRWLLLLHDRTGDVSTGSFAFLAVVVILHALHFSVATMFLGFVTLQSLRDRYDHEYYWGAQFCTWFWHVLGIIWLVIFGAFWLANIAAPEEFGG